MAYQPKSYKKFVATAATATLVASAIAPVASAASFSDVSDRYKEAVDYIVEKGYAQGYPGGTKFGTNDNIKRQDAAVMVARALGAKADGDYPAAGFTDVPADRQWAVNFLKDKKIIDGKEAGKFGANDFMTRGEMAKVVANAYKLVGNPDNEFPFTDVSATFKEYVDALVEAGVTQGKTATQFATGQNVTRGEFALFVHRAEVKQAPATPEVVSVSATNGKQLVVKFATAIDEDTVIESNGTLIDSVIDVVALKKADGTNSPAVADDSAEAVLSEDGKELTISAQGAEYFSGKYTVAVNKGIKDVNGKEVPAFSTIIDVDDKVAPTLVSATAVAKTSTNKVTLRFSEPVQSSGVIAYVDGTAVAVSAGSELNELVLTSGANLEAGKSYEVSVLNVKDFAGNFIAPNPYKTTFIVNADSAAPTVQSVKVTGENKVEVAFDKKVDEASFANNVRLLDVNGELESLFTASVKNDGKTVVLTAGSPIGFGPNGTFTGNLLLGSEIKDTLGNKLGSTFTQNVTFTKDTAAPVVASVKYDSGKIVVKFNEDVTAKAATLTGSSIINDKTGVATALTTAFGAGASDAKIQNGNELVIPTSLSAGNYTLRLAAGVVKDTAVAQNQNAASITSFVVEATSANDTTAPTFVKDAVATDFLNVVVAGLNGSSAPDAEQLLSYVVSDPSGLDLATVRDVNNYTIDGKAVPVGTYVTTDYVDDVTPLTVTLHVPSNKISKTKTDYKLVVSNVKDKAGNTAAPQVSEDITLHDGVKPELKTAAISAGDNTALVVEFGEVVTGVDATDFVFTVNNSNVTGAANVQEVTAGTDKGKYYVTFTTVTNAGKLYLDTDGVAGYSVGDVEVATTSDAAGLLNLKAVYVTGLKVKVDAAANAADAQGNTIVTGTEITVK